MEIVHLPALANLFNVASYNHSWVLHDTCGNDVVVHSIWKCGQIVS